MRSRSIDDKEDQNLGGAPNGNTNALKHGIYVKRLISDKERKLNDSLLNKFRVDYPHINDSILQETVLCFMQLNRALDSRNIDGLQKMDSKLRKALKKIRYHKPEIICASNIPMTREKWMDEFLRKYE